jgi:hypothetical protein
LAARTERIPVVNVFEATSKPLPGAAVNVNVGEDGVFVNVRLENVATPFVNVAEAPESVPEADDATVTVLPLCDVSVAPHESNICTTIFPIAVKDITLAV